MRVFYSHLGKYSFLDFFEILLTLFVVVFSSMSTSLEHKFTVILKHFKACLQICFFFVQILSCVLSEEKLSASDSDQTMETMSVQSSLILFESIEIIILFEWIEIMRKIRQD